MKLPNFPPLIVDILPDTYRHLRNICKKYKEKPDELNSIDYIKVFVENLQKKSAQAIQLFKDGKEKMFDENSTHRRNLTKLTLVFSHMSYELKAIFPDGTYIGEKFRITKSDAAEFWKNSFENRL